MNEKVLQLQRVRKKEVECSNCWHTFRFGRNTNCPFCGAYPKWMFCEKCGQWYLYQQYYLTHPCRPEDVLVKKVEEIAYVEE